MALFGIIVLIFAISWFVKRFGQGGFTQNQHIKIIATMPLGTRERIVLIEAGGQQLLLGITAAAINTLHVFNEPVVLPEREPGTSDFSRKLMTILQQKSSGATGGKNNNSDDSATR
ncbi:flagellar protein FliO [Cellvibrio sp. BR]|nr:flagellar protein FliO [Cellvibrio sp. BR]